MSARETSFKSEETYFYWVCLRVLAEETGKTPSWETVRKAMGSTAKPHSMYMRYWTSLKKPPVPASKTDLPNIQDVLSEVAKEGPITDGGAGGSKRKRGAKTTTAMKAPRGAKGTNKSGSEDEAADELEVEVEEGEVKCYEEDVKPKLAKRIKAKKEVVV